ncbi:hypothetical protein Tco_0978946 [Tanacetum coccineum]|uniref:Uncharacterized protein n=1 Tax=Tanacetum coccineum TaxID=301880 RepID=A0ABQ5EPA9_9ASTR
MIKVRILDFEGWTPKDIGGCAFAVLLVNGCCLVKSLRSVGPTAEDEDPAAWSTRILLREEEKAVPKGSVAGKSLELVQMQGGLISDHAVRLEELSPALVLREKGRSDIRSDMERSVALWLGQERGQESRGRVLRVYGFGLVSCDITKRIVSVVTFRLGNAVLPCVSALRLVARDRADTNFLNRMWHATIDNGPVHGLGGVNGKSGWGSVWITPMIIFLTMYAFGRGYFDLFTAKG